MLEIKPLEAKDYESKYRAAYWQQLSLPQDGMWEVFAQMAGYSELIWGGKPCGFVSVNEQNQLLHFFVMPQYQNQVAEIWQSVLEEKEIQTAQVGSHDPQFFGLCLDQLDVDLGGETLWFCVSQRPKPTATFFCDAPTSTSSR